MKKTLLLVAASLPAWATDLPPVIPVGPISYDEVSFAPGAAPATEDAGVDVMAFAPAEPSTPAFTEPVTPAASSEHNLLVNINAYSSHYQVRGMGFKDEMTRYGWSSVHASYTLPNRNLFGKGLHQRFAGTFGLIWGAGEVLGDAPVFDIHYGLGKEIFPNLTVEAGCTMRYGGMEGYVARHHDGGHNRVTSDINLAIVFDDHQRGFFGGMQWGYGFHGLTGNYLDFEIGYRFTDVVNTAAFGADLELSAGMAPSFGYWGDDVEGVDAYRIKAALLPYTHNGRLGRDAAWQIKPWVEFSWGGSNAAKIHRDYGYSPVDRFQVTVGLEASYRF